MTEKQWLVRKGGLRKSPSPASQLLVTGPWTSSQIIAMVRQGALGADDELCPENGYWFALHETREVKGQLGIDAPFQSSIDQEATQPDLSIAVGASALETTAVAKINRPPQPANPAPIPIVGEKTGFWGILFVLCVILAGIGFLWVLRSLRTS